MLEHPSITLAVATILGILSGLGVGGGSLLMVWLTLVVGMEYTSAKTLNLLFFLPSAIIATLFRWKQCRIPFNIVIPGAIAGCIFAAVFAYLGQRFDTTLLKRLFGILLLVTGIRELFYRPRKAK